MVACKAMIFDLDGTLLNTLEDIGNAVNRMLKASGLPTHDLDAYRHFIGDGWRMLVTRALPEKDRTPRRIDAGVARSQSYYEQVWNDRTHLYEGIEELLGALRGRGLHLAILTNKPHAFALRYVEAYLGQWRFIEVLGQDDRYPPKPDPAGALAIARSMRLAPGEIGFLGDSAVDVKTALAAGMRAFGAAWGFRGKAELGQCGCGVLLDHPMEMLTHLCQP